MGQDNRLVLEHVMWEEGNGAWISFDSFTRLEGSYGSRYDYVETEGVDVLDVLGNGKRNPTTHNIVRPDLLSFAVPCQGHVVFGACARGFPRKPIITSTT